MNEGMNEWMDEWINNIQGFTYDRLYALSGGVRDDPILGPSVT